MTKVQKFNKFVQFQFSLWNFCHHVHIVKGSRQFFHFIKIDICICFIFWDSFHVAQRSMCMQICSQSNKAHHHHRLSTSTYSSSLYVYSACIYACIWCHTAASRAELSEREKNIKNKQRDNFFPPSSRVDLSWALEIITKI